MEPHMMLRKTDFPSNAVYNFQEQNTLLTQTCQSYADSIQGAKGAREGQRENKKWYFPLQLPQTGDNPRKSNLQSVVPGLGALLEKQTLSQPSPQETLSQMLGVGSILYFLCFVLTYL